MNEIYSKYKNVLKNIDDGVIINLNYPQKMEILRFCEKETGHSIPMNWGCTECIFNLIKLFKNLYNGTKK